MMVAEVTSLELKCWTVWSHVFFCYYPCCLLAFLIFNYTLLYEAALAFGER